jgi:uncharacterized protein
VALGEHRASSVDDPLVDLERICRDHLLASQGDIAHDLDHIERVVANARALGAAEHARMEVVVPAAWLHDCVSIPKNSPERGQASRLAGAEAVRLLRSWGFESLALDDIRHAIEAHSFSGGIEPASLEARVLQDADRLDALGAIGLARCLMLGGVLERPLYVARDPFCRSRDPDDLAATVDHFYTKLLHLADRFQTGTGRSEARRRTDVLQHYLRELEHELTWPAPTGAPDAVDRS